MNKSQPGRKGPTAPYGTPQYRRELQAAFDRVHRRLESMTPVEFRASLVRSGICHPDGSLTAPYRDEPAPQKRAAKKTVVKRAASKRAG